MTSFIILLLMFLLISQQNLSNSSKLPRRYMRELPNFSKHINHVGQDLVFGYSVGQHVTFFYALCDRHDDRPEKRCALIFEPLNREGLVKTKTKTCIFDLVSKKPNGIIPRRFLLIQFGRNELIFVWKEDEKARKSEGDNYAITNKYNVTQYWRMKRNYENDDGYIQEHLRVRIVHMKSCRFHETNVTVDEKAYRTKDQEINGLNIVTFANGAEIFFRNEELCGWKKRCLVEYNSKTHKFNYNYDAGLSINYHAAAKIQSTWPQGSRTDPNRLYVVDALINEEDGSVQILDGYGNELEAHYYSWSIFNIILRTSAIAYSAILNLMTLCRQTISNTSLDCMSSEDYFQIDLNLRSKDVRLLRMRSLSKGGFLVLIGYGPEGVTNQLQQLDHVKVDSKGQIVESYGLKNFKCKNEGSKLDGNFFDKKGFEYCYYINCVSPMPEGNKTEIDLDEYHWYFHGYCMPVENEEEVEHVIEHDIN